MLTYKINKIVRYCYYFDLGDSILLHCGEMIPKLKSRTDKSTKSQEHGAGQAGGGKKKNKKK